LSRRPSAPLRAAAVLAALAAAAPAAAAPPASQDRAQAFAKLPYWDGFWINEHQTTTIGGFNTEILAARERGQDAIPNIMKLSGGDAPWSAEGKRRLEEKRRTAGGRKAHGWGFPMMMNSAAPIQFLITPEEVLIINAYADVRHIYTDGRKHPAEEDLWPTVWGDSVGHWEGDTLVVDTIAVKDPYSYFHGAPPLSDQAHYVERIRMVSPDRIESEVTIEDPVTLTGPWKVKVAYERAQGYDRMVQMDFDNDRTGLENGVNTIEPPKDKGQ
jgi:hypothetical protein